MNSEGRFPLTSLSGYGNGVYCAAFHFLFFKGFEIFCQKNIGAKVAHKMLVKLTTERSFLR